MAKRGQDILVCPLEIYKQYFSDWREGGGNFCCDLYREANSFRFFLRLLQQASADSTKYNNITRYSLNGVSTDYYSEFEGFVFRINLENHEQIKRSFINYYYNDF